MKVYFVGMHNKAGMTALDSRTKTGKVIDRIIERFKGASDVEFVKTNLCDTDYMPKSKNEIHMWAKKWHEKHNPTGYHLVVLLGVFVRQNFIKHSSQINARHPASIFGAKNVEFYCKYLSTDINYYKNLFDSTITNHANHSKL